MIFFKFPLNVIEKKEPFSWAHQEYVLSTLRENGQTKWNEIVKYICKLINKKKGLKKSRQNIAVNSVEFSLFKIGRLINVSWWFFIRNSLLSDLWPRFLNAFNFIITRKPRRLVFKIQHISRLSLNRRALR